MRFTDIKGGQIFAPLKAEGRDQPKTHEQPSKEVTQLSFLVFTTDL